MARTGDVLRTDSFSLSAAGRPWIDVHWLFQLLAYGLFQRGGLLALVLGKAVLVAAGALVLLAAVRVGVSAPAGAAGDEPASPPVAASTRLVAGAVLLVALPAVLLLARHLLLVRPVILTLVFLALFLWAVERHRAGAGAAALLLLPVVQVAWANLQGLSALGPAVLGGYLVGHGLRRLRGSRELPAGGGRRLLAALAAVLLAGTLTPFGLAAVLLPLKLLGRVTPGGGNVFSTSIAENVPPFVLERTAPGHMAPLVTVLALVAISFFAGPRPVPLGRLITAAGFGALAMMANRNILLFYWVAIPLAVMNAAPLVGTWVARLPRRWSIALPGLAATGLAAAALLALRGETPLAEPAPFRVPAISAQRIAEAPGQGRVFAADHYGGYLIWALHPRARPYIDTRLVLRTADEYAEYLGLADFPQRFPAFARKQGFDHVLLPTAYPDRYLGLVQHLYGSPDWRLIHTDGTEVLFARTELARQANQPALDLGLRSVSDEIAGQLQAHHRDRRVLSAARQHLARLQLAVGAAGEARHLLTTTGEQDQAAQILLARCHLVEGELALAERLAQSVVKQDDDYVPAHTMLALVALARGDLTQALPHLRRALDEDPYDPEARAILEKLEAARAGAAPTPPP